jgi:hypothetical protein
VASDQLLVIDAILQLRENYIKLTEIQKKQFLGNNRSLIVDLLELEEEMIAFGIISPGEIEKILRGEEISKDYKRIGPLLRQFLFENMGTTASFDQFSDVMIAIGKEGSHTEMMFTKKIEDGLVLDPKELGNVLLAFSDYVFLENTDVDPKQNAYDTKFAESYNPSQNQAEAHWRSEDVSNLDPKGEATTAAMKDNCKYYNEEDFSAPDKVYSKSLHKAQDFSREILEDVLKIVEGKNFLDCLGILGSYAKLHMN